MLPKVLYGLVLKGEVRSTNTAGKFWKMDVKTNAGTWVGNIWDANKDLNKYPKRGDILRINRFKDQTDTKHCNIVFTLDDIEKIEKGEIPEEFREQLIKVPKAPKEWVDNAWDTIVNPSYYESPKSLEFVKRCFAQYPMEDLLKWPAAVSIHHHYQGGYLVHTSEVFVHAKNICDSTKHFYNLVSNDVIMVAAAIHDLGKMETYYIDPLGLSAKHITENSIGHFFYAMNIAKNVAKELDVCPKFLEEVLHCIAAHHGRIEHGSIKPVMSLEALILSMADNLSSKCGFLDNRIKEAIDAGRPIAGDGEFIQTRGDDRFFVTKAIKNYGK